MKDKTKAMNHFKPESGLCPDCENSKANCQCGASQAEAPTPTQRLEAAKEVVNTYGVVPIYPVGAAEAPKPDLANADKWIASTWEYAHKHGKGAQWVTAELERALRNEWQRADYNAEAAGQNLLRSQQLERWLNDASREVGNVDLDQVANAIRARSAAAPSDEQIEKEAREWFLTQRNVEVNWRLKEWSDDVIGELLVAFYKHMAKVGEE